MANCNDLFTSFDETIRLSNAKEENLRTARDAIKEKIEKYFEETLNENKPNFRQQGSFDLRTIVTPIDGEFDIDYGVFLNNLPEDKGDWQNPDEAQDWIYKAVKNHTDHVALKKQKCIRVIYKGEYHVDLPVYGEYDSTNYLADTANGWAESDPKAFKEWLLNKLDDNDCMRRCIRYIKAWADYHRKESELPFGLFLTILISKNFSYDDRDDRAFASTVSNIKQYLDENDQLLNPVDKDEDLMEKIDESTYQNLIDKIQELNNSAKDALRADDHKKACELWVEEFGDRFPSCNDLEESQGDDYIKTQSPAILDDDHRSA